MDAKYWQNYTVFFQFLNEIYIIPGKLIGLQFENLYEFYLVTWSRMVNIIDLILI